MLLHCGAGIGRAGTIAIAVLLAMGEPLDGAARTVADHRPMAGPEAGAQTDLLTALARSRREPSEAAVAQRSAHGTSPRGAAAQDRWGAFGKALAR